MIPNIFSIFSFVKGGDSVLLGLTKNVRGIGVYHHAEVCKSVEGRHDIASEIVRDVRLRNVEPFGDFRLREAALSDRLDQPRANLFQCDHLNFHSYIL